ncbi:MAG: glycosyltransferase family 2 protein [Lachnospiraceae bacterium]|nr:glycosyltransferase family 2 protein [Lachnospiraceae bacterium]
MRPNCLYLVVPCYNEEELLLITADKLKEKMTRLMNEGKISADSKVLFVNDGSKDRTWELIHSVYKKDKLFGGLSFSRNYGHQSAILAGMLTAREKADMVITIDADLQQDIEALDDFIACYQDGCEIVYGVRNSRNTDGVFKKESAGLFYKLMNLMGCEVITNHADYRLMSKKALDALSEYKEVNLFLRGLIPQMGFKSDIVYFDVKARELGQSKYTLKKMINLAMNGITSMSTVPLKLIGFLGIIMCVFGGCVMISALFDWIRGVTVQGWTTNVVLLCLIGGMIMLSQWIVGEYVGKIYMEVKERPRYIIEAFVLDEGCTEGDEAVSDEGAV